MPEGVSAVGSVIAVIAPADEDISGIEEGSDGNGTQQALPEESSAETTQEPEVATTSEISAGTQGTGSVKASPLARRLATEMGVDLLTIKGSGPGGRVVKRDLEGAKTAGSTGATTTTWTPEENEYEDVPTSQMRKSIAKRLVTSIGPVPTFYLTVEVDMNRVIEARESMNSMLEEDGYRISVNDIVLKAVAAALRQHPNCNAQWHDNFVRRFNAVHLGVAVAIDEGLITPVIRNAHAKGIMQIASEVRELAGRARTKSSCLMNTLVRHFQCLTSGCLAYKSSLRSSIHPRQAYLRWVVLKRLLWLLAVRLRYARVCGSR
ncbi:MAG: hypothetical protein Ct9H300mP15_03760 [Gemmatimonadota bacterium]|nr:MAG: hypothetical protein Ct9H300mP15_03760 [Gemmatimonadota bacterium]